MLADLFDIPATYGSGVVAWVLVTAAIVGALVAIFKKGILPLVTAPKRVRKQVTDWADTSPRIEAIGQHVSDVDSRVAQVDARVAFLDQRVAGGDARAARVEDRVNGIDVRLSIMDQRLASIDAAVNHRGPDSPTLSREHALTANMLTRVAEQVERIADHVGLPRDPGST